MLVYGVFICIVINYFFWIENIENLFFYRMLFLSINFSELREGVNFGCICRFLVRNIVISYN